MENVHSASIITLVLATVVPFAKAYMGKTNPFPCATDKNH